mmetsp:Transcript_22660/g.50822  ORF Transcript_22660/g.50822 Transcript_22660/m.50822 type:complete len:588 (-) Transcript_22660:72-1835(-)
MLRALQSVAVLVCLLSTQGFVTRLKVKPFASKHGIVIQEFALTSSHVPEISSLQEYTSFALKATTFTEKPTNPRARLVRAFLTAVKNFFSSILAFFSPSPGPGSTRTSFSTFLSLPSLPVKKLVWKLSGRKYAETRLREIDRYMMKNKLTLSDAEPGRWPPVLVPASTPKASPRAALDVAVKAPRPAAKRSVKDLAEKDLRGRRVLVRCDLNVPIKDGVITDDTRIRGCMPTLQYLTSRGAKVLLTSHLGRPKGTGYEEQLSLRPVTARLGQLIGRPVPLVPDCIGLSVQRAVQGMAEGDVVLLQNSRFYKEEEANDPSFAQALARNADLFVNDAFGTAHRAHASTEGVARFLTPAVAGFLLLKELDYLQGAVEVPKRPFAAIVGGSKVSSKISVIEAMLSKVDKLVLGGGMVFTFLKARGYDVGASLVEDDQLELAKRLEVIAKEKGVKLYLASDVVVADKFAADANTKIVSIDAIPAGWMGLDIGPDTIKDLVEGLSDCKTVIWNGPMGVFEFDAFAKGTNAVANTLAELTGSGCITIIGGGDSVAAVEKAGLADKMSHISTGGGASLELLEGKVLPGVAALNEA